MKKNNIILFALLIISNYSWAQNFLSFESNMNICNNFLSQKLYNDITSIGFMDDDFKNNISENLNSKNLFETNLDFKSTISLNKYSINIESKNNITGKISEDLINLALFGNSKYLGENLTFNNDYILINRYSKIGITHILSKTKDQIITISPSILLGHQFLEYNIEKGEMLTSLNGDFIDYTFKGETHFSSINEFNKFNVNGIGFGADIDYKKVIKQNELYIKIEDIGVINWIENNENYTVDTICHFQGIIIDDIFNFNDSILQNSIDNLNSNYDQNENQYSLRLPVKINAILTKNLKNKNLDFIRLKIKHKPIIYEFPEITGSAGMISNKTAFEIGFKHGGIQNFDSDFISSIISINIKSKKNIFKN